MNCGKKAVRLGIITKRIWKESTEVTYSQRLGGENDSYQEMNKNWRREEDKGIKEIRLTIDI